MTAENNWANMTNATIDEDTEMINFFVPVDKPDTGALVLELDLLIQLIKGQRKKRQTVGDLLFSDHLFEVRVPSNMTKI